MPTTRPLSPKDEAFVAEVARLLRSPWEMDEQRYLDQLHAFSLGATIPAEPMRYPDPECRDCWGEGWVCECHGFARSYRLDGPHRAFERCTCWRRAAATSDAPPTSVVVDNGPDTDG